MTLYVIQPTCPDQAHKGHGWAARRAHPAVAIIRLRAPRAKWQPRCQDCLNRLRLEATDFDLAYLHGHHPDSITSQGDD